VIAVIDASVVIKWLLQDPEREAGTEKATQLMELVTNGEQPVLQPTHWLVEVGAVLARESPGTAVDDVGMLTALELPTTDEL
jgi:predicted nucleic acid-binding protein